MNGSNTRICDARSSRSIAAGAIVTSNYALLIEDKGSGMSLIQDLKREGIRAMEGTRGDKVMRMNAHTARIEAGRVHPAPGVMAR